MSRTAVVLAGGAGERMRSQVPKVLHAIAGRTLLGHVLSQLQQLEVDRIVVVVGADGGATAKHVTDFGLQIPVSFVEQRTPDGTADATTLALGAFGDEDPDGEILIVPGDLPLVRAATLRRLLEEHDRSESTLTLLVAEVAADLPRLLRNDRGDIVGVGPAADAGVDTDDRSELAERCPLVFCVRRSLLTPALRRLERAAGDTREASVVGVVAVVAASGHRIAGVPAGEPEEALGVNDRRQLADATAIVRERINDHWLEQGVTIIDPAHTYIDEGVAIAQDVTLLPGVTLQGDTSIGVGAVLGPDTRIVDSSIGEYSTIANSVVTESEIGSHCSVGPYSHLRPGTVLNDRVKVGSFVELKNAQIGEGAKVPHLAYLGDATVGTGANIGCGTITANYDGKRKHRTTIGDNARTGSNSVLVAPVRVGIGAYTAAGAVVVNDVPDGALARGVPARNIADWVSEREAREHHPSEPTA